MLSSIKAPSDLTSDEHTLPGFIPACVFTWKKGQENSLGLFDKGTKPFLRTLPS